jgi:hypothetical protein
VTRSTAGFDAVAELVTDLTEYETEFGFIKPSLLALVSIGALVRIDDEYMRLDGIDLTGATMTVARGVVDTIPQRHAGGAQVWVQTAMPTTDFRDYESGEEVSARLLTRTTSAVLDPAFAYIDTYTFASRQGRPYPPGDMRVDGDRFADGYHVNDGDIELTWTHRDRIVQGNTLLEHEAASTGPEPGTTYTIRVYGADGTTLLRTVTGLTGTAWTYSTGWAMADGNPPVMWFEVESVRDGYVSWQHYRFYVSRTIGFDEGFDYNFNGGF